MNIKNNESFISAYLPPSWLRLLVIVLLVIGIFFRFVNIDKKLYWCDEVYTSLRISGYLAKEMNSELRTGYVVSPKDLQKYQSPNQEKSTFDTIKGLVVEESQLTPLYFVMVRFWVKFFGNSVAVTRSLSALISLLTFPCLYWLCQELFKSRVISWIAISLVAISPVHIVFAQEARSYSLWIVSVLISGAAIIRAMRLQTKTSWGIYTATLILGLYSQLFFVFVVISQGIYVAFIEHFRLTKRFTHYIIATILACLTFSPWAWIFITHPTPEHLTWVNIKQTLLDCSIRWSGLVSRAFVDLGIAPNAPAFHKIIVFPFILMVLALIAYAIYFICIKTKKEIWLFVLTLSGSVILPLVLLDFGFGKRYGTTRYILPSIIGIQLAIAYLLSMKITPINHLKRRQQTIWSLIFAALLTSGIVSATISSQSQMWWTKQPEVYGEYPQMAEIINKSNQPLVITDTDMTYIQVLSRIVDEKTKFQILDEKKIPGLKSGFSEVFLFHPSAWLRNEVEKLYGGKITTVHDSLLQVIKSE